MAVDASLCVVKRGMNFSGLEYALDP